MVDEELSLGVVHFVGTPGRLSDSTPDARVSDALGERARQVLPRIQALIADLYATDPLLWRSRSLPEIHDGVLAWLSERCPQLSDDAARAIANRFTYDWK